MWEGKKKLSIYVCETSDPARHVKLWSLNMNLFFEECHQLTFKPYLAEDISLQRAQFLGVFSPKQSQ